MSSSKPTLSSKPPVKSVDDFIADAERMPRVQPSAPVEPPPAAVPAQPPPMRAPGRRTLPWKRPSIREDVKKPYNLRFPEAYLLKLKYIAENTPDSMQTFCLSVLLPAIDKKVGELLEKGS